MQSLWHMCASERKTKSVCQVGFSLCLKGYCVEPGRCGNFCERSGATAENDCNSGGRKLEDLRSVSIGSHQLGKEHGQCSKSVHQFSNFPQMFGLEGLRNSKSSRLTLAEMTTGQPCFPSLSLNELPFGRKVREFQSFPSQVRKSWPLSFQN